VHRKDESTSQNWKQVCDEVETGSRIGQKKEKRARSPEEPTKLFEMKPGCSGELACDARLAEPPDVFRGAIRSFLLLLGV
jgi:hypothetical protein